MADLSAVLNCPMGKYGTDSQTENVLEYLMKLLSLLIDEEEEEFDSKRPFGNRGWLDDVGYALADSGLISKSEYGTIDLDDVQKVLQETIAGVLGITRLRVSRGNSLEGTFVEPPPPLKPGPKPGHTGKKSRIFTDDKVELLVNNPGRWIVLKESTTQNQYSNAVQWVRRNEGFKVVGRHNPNNPPSSKLTLFAVYVGNYNQEEELDASEVS